GMSVSQASYALATFGLVGGISTLLIGGRIVDFLFQRGITDAHYRYYAVGGLVLALFGGAAHLSSSPTGFFLLMAPAFFPLGMGAIGASAVQLVTPPGLRGRVSAIYLLAVALIGMSAGPSFIGLMTDYIFRDPQAIGMAMALTFGIVGVIVTMLFLYGMSAMRRAVAQV
ncbi:MAG: hypothetical protein ABW048_06565, partial [Sphingobium sp.]